MLEGLRYRFFCFFLEQRVRHERDAWSAIDRLSDEKAHGLTNFRTAERVAWLRRILRCNPSWGAGHLLFGEESLSLGQVSDAFAGAQAAIVLESSVPRESNSLIRYGALVLVAECYLRTGDTASVFETLAPLKEPAFHHVDAGGPQGKLAERMLGVYAGALLLEGREQEASALLLKAPGLAQRSESHALIQYARRKAEGALPQTN